LTDEGSACGGFSFQFLNDRLFTSAMLRIPPRDDSGSKNNPVWQQILADEGP